MSGMTCDPLPSKQPEVGGAHQKLQVPTWRHNAEDFAAEAELLGIDELHAQVFKPELLVCLASSESLLHQAASRSGIAVALKLPIGSKNPQACSCGLQLQRPCEHLQARKLLKGWCDLAGSSSYAWAGTLVQDRCLKHPLNLAASQLLFQHAYDDVMHMLWEMCMISRTAPLSTNTH